MSLSTDTPGRIDGAGGALSRILHLLADDVPESTLAEAVRDATSGEGGTGDEDTGDEASGDGSAGASPLLRTALQDAQRIRALLDRRARREQEMQGLYETARDLTSLRGTDDVLSAIVDRVRRLLGCACSYLALVEPASGDALMRVTAGTRTAAIRSIRQRPGSGVGGYVIETGQPIATSNYCTDPRLRRERPVASAVELEGLVAIAGVPITIGTRVFGALFAAERHERAFGQSEIALLSSLAAHASVVIENARLYERAQEASAELREANARLHAQREVLERAARVHEQLMPMALTRVDLPHLVDTLAELLEGTVVLLDPAGGVLAHGAAPGAPRFPGPVGGTRPAGAQIRVVPVRAGKDSFGRLLLARSTPIPDADVRALERSAQTAALLLLMERQSSIVAQELHAELVEDLLADRAADPAAFRRRARRLGVLDLDRPHSVVVLTAAALPRRRLLAYAVEFATARGGVVGEHAGQVVALVPDPDAGALARAAVDHVRGATGSPATAGAAGAADSVDGLRSLHRGAARCHRLLLALGREGEGSDLAELGVVGRVLEDTTPAQVQRLLDRTLGPLLAYDQRHGTVLVPTLDRYFAAGQSPPDTARELGVHINTVYQRLDRIDQVLGGRCWREPRGALEMQMVLQFHRLRG
ncbi:GAF domain-containing protein [Pseudonocardia sp. KRD-184]|uniref:GAF domain-containing protein n=1 Tax=Pseudonocardia oceani TaxID=2792013 RepID=A0ABS6UF42_9PSEU|nr:GAF domain-containing protein [Pseudonocardia oceani]MBW0093061.1 GAF domain-containing protein [Pseudonocardia oceani]MBW0099837.1 GAF domain-containing protein [Pseudonocardia oceani]MBW0109610.1 GAF domain-containing protein [Pseudonocardia oceani]MBW0122716.1 GAF domain-containing protein [Pseudonocardia oceani]MBW0130847.1 GAF domain-containing protein [Pseudonocardia oceani]